MVEFIKQVLLEQIQEVPKQIAKVETRVVEKIVPAEQQLIHEVAVDVPQVCVHEVVTQISTSAQGGGKSTTLNASWTHKKHSVNKCVSAVV